MSANPFELLPSVAKLLDHPALAAVRSGVSHEILVQAIRREVESLRQSIIANQPITIDPAAIVASIERRIDESSKLQFRTVINATGIVLHTNLGRSPLAESAAAASYQSARGYLNLELDLATGQRSSRQDPIRELIAKLTGAESATAVNNCAAATVIVLRTLAAGKEVIVSRGQLIEIGGSFRIPEIMAASGAILREVGTTNITRIGDYEAAITPNTAALMRIHASNFRIRGFTEAVNIHDLAALGREHNLPVIDDVGSGAAIDVTQFGLEGEPTIREGLDAGADLVLFSGDKLLGGPQAGIIAGKKQWIDAIERDPLMRAFRLDKMTLAALEVTLKLHCDRATAMRAIPTLRMLSMPLAELRERTLRFAERLMETTDLSIEVHDDVSYIGGGTLPDQALPTVVISLSAAGISETVFAERLRIGTPAVVARIQKERVILDLRTVFSDQEDALYDAVIRAVAGAAIEFKTGR